MTEVHRALANQRQNFDTLGNCKMADDVSRVSLCRKLNRGTKKGM